MASPTGASRKAGERHGALSGATRVRGLTAHPEAHARNDGAEQIGAIIPYITWRRRKVCIGNESSDQANVMVGI